MHSGMRRSLEVSSSPVVDRLPWLCFDIKASVSFSGARVRCIEDATNSRRFMPSEEDERALILGYLQSITTGTNG